MFAKRFVYFLLISSAALSCKKDDPKTPSKSELLAGTTSKSWIITKITPEDDSESASCHLASVQNADNYWIFTAGGAFEYNPGTIFEDPNCKDDDCCSDLANLYGTWSLYNSDAKLKVHIVGKIDSGVKTAFPTEQQSDLIDVTISTLTATQLIVTQDGVTVEFSVHN